LRFFFDLPFDIQLDFWVRYVDETMKEIHNTVDLERTVIDDYTTFDVRMAWHPVKALELSITGRNIAQSTHFEYEHRYLRHMDAKVDREWYFKAVWTY